MVPQIKGPIKIKAGEPVPEAVELAAKVRLAQKLGIKLKPKEAQEITEKKYTREELEKMSFAELRELGRKLRVRGRSKEGLINDILAIQEGRKEPEI